MPLAPNQQLYEYRIVRRLGQGGFGTVYLAHDTLLDRPVAIKELTLTRQTDEQAFKRFLLEARTAGGLNHPNIVTVYALKVEGSNVYLVMECVGGSLRGLLEKHGKLDIEQAVRIAIDVCEGLAAVHAKGIFHRDIKPENILLTEDNRAKVSDFGIAHVPRSGGGTSLTQTGFQPGTLVYMSPEQVLGKPVDARSDVYQVGELLYEMLAGRHYIDLAEIERQARDSTGGNSLRMQAKVFDLLADAVCVKPPAALKPQRPDAPDELRAIIRAALSKKTSQRPADALALARQLGVCFNGHTGYVARQPQPSAFDVVQGSEGWLIISTRKMTVRGRPKSHTGDRWGWLILGHTPGTVTVPADYDLGIKLSAATDNALAVVAQKLAGSIQVQYLDLEDSKITDAGLAYLKGMTGLTILDLNGCRQITGTGLAHLKGLTGLTYLNLDDCEQITDAGLAHLGGLTSLTSLKLSSCRQITDAGLAHLKGLTGLTHLNLCGCKQITGTGLAHLKGMTGLTGLEFHGCTDAWLMHVQGMTGLTSLYLSGCGQITNAGLAHLKGMTGLTRLSLFNCEQITDDGLAYLKGMTGLTYLDLTNCYLSDAGLAHLKGMTSLTSLILAGSYKPITDAGLAHLKGMTGLTSLNLMLCKITDAGLAHLKGLTSLTELNLNSCYQITDAGLVHLEGLTSLTNLDFSSCNLTDAGLVHLKGMTSLTRLDLGGCNQITDAGLVHLKGLTSLTDLNLEHCEQITDAGLAHLKGLTSLTDLNLEHCEQITDAGLAHLKGLTGLTSLYLSNCGQITDAGLAHLKGLTSLTSLHLRSCRQITSAGLAHLQRPGLGIGRYVS